VAEQRGQVSGALSQESSDVLERVSDGVVALDRNWRYTYVNSRAASLFGRQPEDLVGRHIWTEFPEGVGQPFQLAYQKAMDDQIFIEMESYYEPWDRWFENRIYPSLDGVSIFFHEITGRKQAEQAARENAELLSGHNQVLELIARGEPLERTLDVLLRVIEARCPGMLCSILLLDADGIHVRHGGAPSLPQPFVQAIDGLPIGPRAGSCGTAAFRREPVVVADIAIDPLWDDYRELALAHGLRACWSTPIVDEQDRVLGTFALYFRAPGLPNDRHQRLIDLSTYTAAIAIAKHRETHALHASEERLRLAVTRGNVGIWELCVETNRLELSDWLKTILGWSAGAELTRTIFLEAIQAEDRPAVAAALDSALVERATFDAEFRVPAAGSPRWLAVTGRAEYDAAGRPVRMLGVGRDITNRKRAEEETARREAQLADAQRLAALGSYEWDVRSNSVYRSDELCRIFGVTREAFEPTFEGYLPRVHPEDRSTTQRTIETAFRERTPFEFEERIVRPDGVVRLLHSQGHWILDADQQPVKLLGICQDITERRRAEDQLRRSEERFQIVARATNDAIWDWDLGTNGVWWNQGITTLFNYDAADVGAAMDWRSARIHPDDLGAVESEVRAVMDARAQFWSGEYRFRRADGSYADVFDRGFVIYDRTGGPVRMIGAIADISERKQALEMLERRVAARTAELQEKNRELEDEVVERQHVTELLRDRNEELKAFAYTVSHDLKAPLRGIAGYAHELQRRHRTGLADRALLCIDRIVTAAHNLDRLIEDLLHYSRLDAETPSRTTVELAPMLDTILADRKTVAHGVELDVALGVTTVHTWERGLFQVLANLIDNALKYSRDATPPRLSIASLDRGDVTRLVVTDNGIGFDMKYHDRIFGLFNRLVRQEEFDGTGAGLAIVRKIVDKVGGRIWAESTPGAGARFFVELPNGDGGSPANAGTR
jgi:PAS domain S-box-containing protein